ncbi:MAG: oligosaccharide flippase family protein [Phycisphaerae bacterium]
MRDPRFQPAPGGAASPTADASATVNLPITPFGPGASADAPRRPSLVVNAVSNWLALATNIAIGVVLTPLLIQHLGKDGFGIWSLAGSIIGYYGMLHLGVASAITPYTARYVGRNDWHGVGAVANTSLVMFTSIGVIVLIAAFALAAPLAAFFQVTGAQRVAFVHTVWLLGAAAAVAFPAKVFVSVVRAYEQYVPGNIVVIASSLLRAVLTVLWLLQGKGLFGVALAVLIGDAVGLIANAWLCRRYAHHLRFHLAGAQWAMFRRLLLFGGTSVVIVVAETLRFNIDSIVIGRFVGLETVGVYAIAAVLVRYANRSIRVVMKVLNPRFAVLYGAGDHDKLRATLLRSLSVSSLLAFGGAALLIIIARPLIIFWVGDGFADAFLPLAILMAALAFDFAQNPSINFLYAADRIRPLAVLNVVEALCNVTISLALVSQYGMLGVALGTAIPCIVLRLGALPRLVTRVINLPLAAYYARMLPAAAVAAAGVVAARWALL